MKPPKPYLRGKDSALGRQTEYFAQETLDFIKSLGAYANNNYKILIQKWGIKDAEIISCRIEDSFDEQANLKRGDDWKDILFYEPVDNITIGMLAWFEGNTWLGFNTRNIASLTSAITVRRCDNELTFVDEFNNVTRIPFVFDKYTMLNSTAIEKASEPVSLINGYKNAWVQYNEYTATLRTNDRMIINGQAFTVRGIDSVSRKTTTDRDSVRLMAFVLMRSEERDGDDLLNDIADADKNIWIVTPNILDISGGIGDVGTIETTITHNGVINTEYGVVYSSDNEQVITVDQNGNYELVGEGEALIRCSFEKNEHIESLIHVSVSGEQPAPADNYYVAFEEIPQQIAQWDSVTLTADLYLNGTKLASPVTFVVDGVPAPYYRIMNTTDNSITIKCNAPYRDGKLRVVAKAEADGTEVLTKIKLSLVSSF